MRLYAEDPAQDHEGLLIELPQAGNVRMIGNYAGDPTDRVVIGTPMSAVFEDHDDAEVPYTLVQWR